MIRRKNNSGFTLVELMLAMTFISILLLAIAMLIMQIGSIYTKGLTLREVNEAGQRISRELQQTLNQTPSSEVKTVGDATSGGRYCAGTIVYAWNTGKSIGQVSAFNRKQDSSTDIRFVKFERAGVTDYCEQVSGVYPDVPNDARELLGAGNSAVAVHSFTSVAEDIPGGQAIYSITIKLGTTDQATLDAAQCNGGDRRDDERCAVNEFNFTARSGQNGIF